MRKKFFFFALCVAQLLFLPTVVNSTRPSSSSYPPIDLKEMKILSWNIYMLPHLDFKNSNKLRAEAIAKELNQSDYSIIVFQEAFDRKSRNIIRDVLEENFPFFYGPVNNSNWYSTQTSSGLWIASRIPLNEIHSIRFDIASGFDRFANKGAVLLEGEWHKQVFQLVATHIQSDDYGWEIREHQIRDIHNKLLLPYSRDGIPQIICGDFNTDRAETGHYNAMLTVMGAEDGILSGIEKYSFSSDDNEITKVLNEKPRLIDYILLRNSLAIKSISRKIAVIKNNWGLNHHSLSDHNAIEATIAFSN
jgi:endonuclease/exonuclease/phosphatase family metal-dependent hydrolase